MFTLRLIKKALQENVNLNTIANLDEAMEWSGFKWNTFFLISTYHVTHVICVGGWTFHLMGRIIQRNGSFIYLYIISQKHAKPSLFAIIAQSWLANTIEVGCFCPKGRTPPTTLGGGVWDLPIDGRNTAPANGWWLSRYSMAECASFDTSVVGCRIFEPSTVLPRKWVV